MRKLNVAVVGCGNISSIYLKNCREFEAVDVVACADIDLNRARAKAEEFHVPHFCTVEEVLANPDVDIVLNLTIPAAHAEVSMKALEAGKHVYVEKPLAVSLEDGRKLVEYARERGLRIGTAPDTVLGGGIQTCRKLIDDGAIGRPVAATAFMMGHGPEGWHPDPEFFYKIGGGPMYDMGPYYLTTFVTLLGPVRRVTGSAQISSPERIITSKPKYGQKIVVETPTHIAGVLDFQSGAVGTIITSFDVWHHQLPFIEIYGTEGTLSVPDPNTFGGPVRLRRAGSSEWEEIPLTHGYTENSRGIGLVDMVNGILHGDDHKANGNVALHVLEIMHGIHEASRLGVHYQMTTECARPAPMPPKVASSL